MTTLHDRLLRAVTERLEFARMVEALSPSPWQTDGEEWGKVRDRQGNDLVHDVFEVELQRFVAANDPATVIRQCEADLRRLERHRPSYPGDVEYDTHVERTESGKFVEVRDDEPVPPYWCERCDCTYPCDDIDDLAAALGVAVEGDETTSEHGAPIRYQRSHVLPSDDDPRGGNVDVAFIPGFIERTGRPPLGDEDVPMHPWLRLAVDDATAVLDRRQVLRLYHTLGDWLIACRSGGASEGDKT